MESVVGKAKIVVIDDMYPSLFSLISLLQDEYSVFAANSGRKGLELVRKVVPDIILLDVIMDEMDGYEVITELKKDPATKDIPVVFITGKDAPNDEIQGLLLGALDYITKPTNDFAVKLCINNLIDTSNFKTLQKQPSNSLVQMLSRRNFNELLAEKWQTAIRSSCKIIIVIFKIGEFENYNNEHGYQKGENILETLSTIIVKNLGSGTQVARWSGSELAVVLSGIEAHDARVIARKICQETESRHPELSDTITINFGVASASPYQGDDYTLDNFIVEAAVSLYNAKNDITTDLQSTANTHKHIDIADFVLTLGSKLDYDDMLDMLVDKMMSFTNSDACTLYVQENNQLHFRIIKNKSMGINKNMADANSWPSIPLNKSSGEYVSAYSAINQEIVAIADVYTDTNFNFSGTKKYDESSGYRTKSMLTLPLMTHKGDQSKVLGVIQLINAIDPYTKEITTHESIASISLLSALSRVASDTLESKLQVQEIANLYNLTIRDSLTGLGNRRHCNDLLSKEWNASLRKRQPLGFMVLSIDSFEKINDTYGRVSGDRVLKSLAAILRNTVPLTQNIVRWGGDEFAIILPNYDLDKAFFLAESLREKIEKTDFKIDVGVQANITISIGVHSILVTLDSDYTLLNFFSDAEGALYRAKREGCNKVCRVEM